MKGLVVSLNSLNLVDTTDSAGRFHLLRRRLHTTEPVLRTRGPVMRGGRELSFTIDEGVQPVTLTLYRPNGRRVEQAFDGFLTPGRHVLPLHLPERTAAGGHLALLDRGGASTCIRLVQLNGRLQVSSVARLTGRAAPSAPAMLHKAGHGPDLPAVDSLTIVHFASDTHTVGIPIHRGSVAIAMDMVPHEVVALAMAEMRRCPAEVGCDRGEYPGALKDYLRRTGRGTCDYEAWCSEFVSWVYKAAGLPFTGGHEGGWMFTYSMAIKRWFGHNERFVSRTDPDYQTFTPAPGDYIRYRNDWGGHSGIVRKVEGTTLYTIEGNIGNRVVLRTIRNYKNRSDIDGFGMRSGARGTKVVVVERGGKV